ncbi:hypothetical protein AAE028_32820 [Sinorhizobium sp. CB9]
MTSLSKKQTGFGQRSLECLSRIICGQLPIKHPQADFQRGLVRLAIGVASPFVKKPFGKRHSVSDSAPLTRLSSSLEIDRGKGLTVFHGAMVAPSAGNSIAAYALDNGISLADAARRLTLENMRMSVDLQRSISLPLAAVIMFWLGFQIAVLL